MLNLQNRRVTVMGLGHFGGGIGVVEYLLRQGALVTLTDLQTREQLASSLAQIDESKLTGLILGEHRDELFTDTDLVVANPAVRPGNRFVQLAIDQGIEVTSEIELFWERCPSKKLVVTGSTGKSTTASLIYQCLLAAGFSAHLGGNIGGSLLKSLDTLTADDWCVLELSSFQLAALDSHKPSPDAAVVTNFFPNHLDWHGSLDAYREAKQTVCAWQKPDQIIAFNADDADLALWATDAKVVWYGKECWRDRPGVVVGDDHLIVRTVTGGWKIELADLPPELQSPHGLMNVAAALALVTVGMQIPIEKLVPAFAAFRGLPHRLETIAEFQERTFIDDSKATTPEATQAALTAIQQPIVLIAGGKDKGADFGALAEAIQERVRGVIFIGDTDDALKERVIQQHRAVVAKEKRSKKAGEDADVGWIQTAGTLEEAVYWAWDWSEEGDAILLSPACASHAEFRNYEHRGDQFAQLVRSLANP
ncbi:UDP-N-acetylmuramoyl-L-alanine--D-glutamate ligase [Planctomicrobium sp. SH527]|uniref:UDP-N-acetylmuramoyl-L-alanine--D-glutamate ligase n=1 Tax=Planctomicrobium sp. SH527 TaxID=3448123 RepID=UPI003F5B2472